MKNPNTFFNKDWRYNTLVGCIIYIAIACSILYIDGSLKLITILSISVSTIILPISSSIIKLLLANIWKQLFYSLIFPLAALTCLYAEKTPGLNKAQPLEKIIIFSLIWGILFLTFHITNKLTRKSK